MKIFRDDCHSKLRPNVQSFPRDIDPITKFAPPSKFPLLNLIRITRYLCPHLREIETSRTFYRSRPLSSFLSYAGPRYPKEGKLWFFAREKGKGRWSVRGSLRASTSSLSAAVHPPRDPCPRAAVMSTLIITAKVPSPNCSGDRIPRVKRKETKPRSSKTLSLFLSRRCLHSFLLEEKNLELYFDREFLSSGCIPTIATESRGTIFRFSRTLSIDRRTDRFVRNKRITRRGKWSWREKGRSGF